jgi:hypothetical protein
MAGKQLLLAIAGGVLGGLIGAIIAIASGYGLAEALGISSRETQACDLTGHRRARLDG